MPDELSYPWYTVVRDQSLEQGDILFGFEVPDFSKVFTRNTDDYEVDLLTMDVVILTQSCDLQHKKTKSVVLCPVMPYKEFVEEAVKREEPHWRNRDYQNGLRRGNIPGFHLLSDFAASGISIPVSLVNFREIYSAPTAQVRDFVANSTPRLRLCPPYKEHLAQAFARFFMRVGLPVDIPPEKLKLV